MSILPLHPLLNKESTHYVSNSTKLTAIELIESQLTIVEIIGWCKANINKYKYRKDLKGQKRSDLKKIKTYENYLELLLSFNDVSEKTVSEVFKDFEMQFKYTVIKD